MLYQLIPKVDLDKENIPLFVTIELRNLYPQQPGANEPVTFYTSMTTFSTLVKEIALKLGAAAEELVLKDTSVNKVICDDSSLQGVLKEIYNNHRTQPHFVLPLLIEFAEPIESPSMYYPMEPNS